MSTEEIDAVSYHTHFDQEKFAKNMSIFIEEYGKAMKEFIEPRTSNIDEAEIGSQSPILSFWNDDTSDYIKTFSHIAEVFIKEPKPYLDASIDLWKNYLDVWMGTLRLFQNNEQSLAFGHDIKDSRFNNPEWIENPLYAGLKQAYQATVKWADTIVADAKIDDFTKQKAQFYMKQILSAISPTNTIWTNPELLHETIASNGENLVNGMRMFAEDLRAGGGHLRLRQSDMKAFQIGKNVANTEGAVIYRNELIELIHYKPINEKVFAQPVLIIPPWINKFYILDLTPEKSYIRWCLEQGLNVFCISWVNPDSRHKDMSFSDYITTGLYKAVDAIREITGHPSVHAIGYCVGGTMLSTALAIMAQKHDRRISSATLLTTQVDFSDPGDLKVFIDKEQLSKVTNYIHKQGYLDGQWMSTAFNMLKPHDLIWPYFVNTYLKGKEPSPFDMLYWNSDPTRQAATNHLYYLTHFYLHNSLSQGKLEILGYKPKLSDINIPIFNLATKEDHIAPASSVFNGAQLFNAPLEFVLAGSGHIAGVVNPPSRNKYQYWTGKSPKLSASLKDWATDAIEHDGSWWPYWVKWFKKFHPIQTQAPIVGSHPKYPILCAAPGTYVLVREDAGRVETLKVTANVS